MVYTALNIDLNDTVKMALFSRFSPLLQRSCGAARKYATKGPGDHEASMVMWRKLTYFVAFPCITVCALKTYLDEREHMKHFRRPEFIPYEYLRILNKNFPWGDGKHTLLFNPKVNALRDGYEDDLEEEHH